jgi:hypothetical protein
MKVDPFLGEAIEVRRLKPRCAVTGDVTPSHVVRIDEDDVGTLGGGNWGLDGQGERAQPLGQHRAGYADKGTDMSHD